MDLDLRARQMILKWNPDEPGTLDFACWSFFLGYDKYVIPMDRKKYLTKDETHFLSSMTIAYQLVKRIFQPRDTVLH